ncbi:MAG TPA: glycoside-pentoside-hexuronide (GPH):cation symporter [Victivallales bacterium]|nr:glycoside-pentoside-hexuronide (GPH):cation symporter [Victivallales bacterium]
MNNLKFKDKFSYGVGSLGKDLYMGMINYYLLIYFTDVFGITALAVGTLFFVARLWDAINDPIMGIIADRTKTRIGKYRPYILIIPFFAAAAFIMLFTVPHLGTIGKLVWAYITYIAVSMTYTALDVPMMSLVPVITRNQTERTSLLGFSRWFSFLAFGAASVLALPLISWFGGENSAKGYQILAIVIAAVAFLSSMTLFFNIKETRVLQNKKNAFKDYIEVLRTNKPFQKVIFTRIAYDLGIQMSGGILVYWAIYYLGRIDLVPIISLVSIVSSLIGFMIVPSIMKRIGKKKSMTIALSIIVLVSFGVLFFGKVIPILLVLMSVQGFAISLLNLCNISMLADTGEYSQYKTGSRSDALLFSINTFSYKIALAIAGGIMGIFLTVIQYVPDAEQTAHTLKWLNIMFSLGPVIFMIAGVIINSKYELTESRYNEILIELDARKTEELNSKNISNQTG